MVNFCSKVAKLVANYNHTVGEAYLGEVARPLDVIEAELLEEHL